MANFEGYDIDPTMVRIAQVNMYLHQFKNPKIFQYDSLSSEERWNDRFDVILANPPFMSPKGGIKPHSKFGIQSSRSEVLFVDYIINHLRPRGRAGIIVPEGIIFQSGTAYKQLRKNLVEEGLYAVASLPSGVFAPYSGVKTSILFFNNELAKTSREILFVKIEQDGFDLGAQRRVSIKNDLPQALTVLNKWNTGEKVENKLAVYVEKSKIGENGEYNLSVERYRIATDYTNAKWSMVKLEDVCDVYQPKTITSNEIKESGKYKVFGANGVIGYFDEYNHEESEVAVTCRGATCGTINFTEPRSWITGNAMVIKPKENNLNKRYLFFLLRSTDLSSVITGAAQPQITGSALKPFLIPLPPLEIQGQIVAELDGYTKIIEGAKQIVRNWKPKIDIDPAWEKVKLGEVCEIYGGGTPSRTEEKYWGGAIPWLSARYFSDDHRIKGSEMITELGLKNSSSKIAPKGSTILITRVSVGKFAIADQDYAINQDLTALESKGGNLDAKYLWLVSEIVAKKIKDNAVGVGVTGVTRDFVVNQEIPLPSHAVQKQIVEKIEAERAHVESANKLIAIYEQKTKEVISKLWQD
jgi:type I restriction enzyme M protein